MSADEGGEREDPVLGELVETIDLFLVGVEDLYARWFPSWRGARGRRFGIYDSLV